MTKEVGHRVAEIASSHTKNVPSNASSSELATDDLTLVEIDDDMEPAESEEPIEMESVDSMEINRGLNPSKGPYVNPIDNFLKSPVSKKKKRRATLIEHAQPPAAKESEEEDMPPPPDDADEHEEEDPPFPPRAAEESEEEMPPPPDAEDELL